jgi:hypothetical protein
MQQNPRRNVLPTPEMAGAVPACWPLPAMHNGTHTGLDVGRDLPQQRDPALDPGNGRPGMAPLAEPVSTHPPGVGGA